jgi:hypothetical protein
MKGKKIESEKNVTLHTHSMSYLVTQSLTKGVSTRKTSSGKGPRIRKKKKRSMNFVHLHTAHMHNKHAQHTVKPMEVAPPEGEGVMVTLAGRGRDSEWCAFIFVQATPPPLTR